MKDLHNFQGQYERIVQRIKESEEIIPDDKKVMFRYRDYCLSHGIGIAKITTYLSYIIKYASMLGLPIQNANKDDVMRVVAEMNQNGYSEETKKSFKVMLRRLYRIVRGVDENGKEN